MAEQQTELVYGFHPIIEILKAKKRKIMAIYTTRPEPKAWKFIKDRLPVYPITTNYVSRDVLTRMAGTTDHQGIVAYAAPFILRKKPFLPDASPKIILLDGIQDPRNVGAIIRSAHCTGMNGIILCAKNASPITPTVLKSSAGLAEHCEIKIATSAKTAVQELKAAGYNIFLTVLDKGTDATTVAFTSPLCLVIGSEEVGISSDIATSGVRVTLPQKTEDISYNASVAAGIFMFLVMQQK
jgi:23S rRNA (guanosine2251-2'-O)-methyltransferase